MKTTAAFSRLLQLASPALPIGAYSYSQGFEWAIESGDVTDKPTAQRWISDVLLTYYAQFELPVMKRLFEAWQNMDESAIQHWDSFYKAGRDSAETRLESIARCAANRDKHANPRLAETELMIASVVLSSKDSYQCSIRGATARRKNSRVPEPDSRRIQWLPSKSLKVTFSFETRGC